MKWSTIYFRTQLGVNIVAGILMWTGMFHDLFPFLSGTKNGHEEYLEYNAALSRFNRNLKTLKEVAGITSDVTSYTIRHSFAMALKEQNVPIEMISELLGHKSIKTTQIYLRSFSLEKMTVVNKSCFENVYNYMPEVG